MELTLDEFKELVPLLIKEEIAIRIRTKEEEETLLRLLDKLGYWWRGGPSLDLVKNGEVVSQFPEQAECYAILLVASFNPNKVKALFGEEVFKYKVIEFQDLKPFYVAYKIFNIPPLKEGIEKMERRTKELETEVKELKKELEKKKEVVRKSEIVLDLTASKEDFLNHYYTGLLKSPIYSYAQLKKVVRKMFQEYADRSGNRYIKIK